MRKDRCKENIKGFTLIELLVVVIIIGILAAIAVSQYQKAVEKSRAAEALTLLKTVYQASNLYYLEHGRWPTQVSQLDVKIPWTRAQNWYTVGTYRPGVSNGEWSMQLSSNPPQQYGVSIGRLTGPYAGIAFAIYKVPPSQKVPADKLICIEGPEREYVLHKFKKSKGAYCQRIWGGTELPSGISWGMNYFVVK